MRLTKWNRLRIGMPAMAGRMAAALFAIVAVSCGDGSEQKAGRSPATADAVKAGAPVARYAATLEEGIKFYVPGLPEFVAEMSGISVHESWGRWTVGPVAKIKFAKPLPLEFELVITGSAYRPNVGERIEIVCGGVTQSVTFASELGKGSDVRRVAFKLSGPEDGIEIRIPKPTVPPPGTGDARALGIALSSLKIAGPAK